MSALPELLSHSGVSPRRILMAVDGLFPSNGGAEIQALRLALALKARGHQLTFLAPLLWQGTKQVQTQVQGIPIERLRGRYFPGLSRYFLRRAMRCYLDEHGDDFDVIHVHMVDVFAVALGAWSGAGKTLRLAKFSGATEFNGGLLDPNQRWRPRHIYARHYVRKLDILHLMSLRTQQALVQFDLSCVKMLMRPNGIDLARFPRRMLDAEPPRRWKIAFCGRLDPIKRLDVAIESLALLLNEGHDVALHLIGDGEMKTALVAQAQACGCAARVIFHGHQSEPATQLLSCDLYWQPSESEGLPTSVIEAQAAMLPVVATCISGNEDLVEDGQSGFLIPVADPKALMRRSAQLMQDYAMYQKFCQQARRNAQRHDLQQVAQILEAHYCAGTDGQ